MSQRSAQQKHLLCQQAKNSEEHGGRVDLQMWGSISQSLDAIDGGEYKDTKNDFQK